LNPCSQGFLAIYPWL